MSQEILIDRGRIGSLFCYSENNFLACLICAGCVFVQQGSLHVKLLTWIIRLQHEKREKKGKREIHESSWFAVN